MKDVPAAGTRAGAGTVGPLRTSDLRRVRLPAAPAAGRQRQLGHGWFRWRKHGVPRAIREEGESRISGPGEAEPGAPARVPLAARERDGSIVPARRSIQQRRMLRADRENGRRARHVARRRVGVPDRDVAPVHPHQARPRPRRRVLPGPSPRWRKPPACGCSSRSAVWHLGPRRPPPARGRMRTAERERAKGGYPWAPAPRAPPACSLSRAVSARRSRASVREASTRTRAPCGTCAPPPEW
jgi:hypothetical protein